ncbi:hypothetical protein [Shimia abyssi]|uniref:Uncharacterized protein n=1 Tax=Shimia abyssi TaxID=1662395 RepID=A0A2P8FD17_9RHOB|nr:hypothetical protein [Shimia abyssi]PSL19588.1 hypothetical protein CLV88_10510 [Shimia abyssi]
MDIFEEDFPEWVNIIRALRIVDAETDEICRDYEILKVDLHDAERIEGISGESRQADLRASLSGLEKEIQAKVMSSRGAALRNTETTKQRKGTIDG